ncbi:hypothetical protein GGR57DRAFT_504697 [Xylariaceae sp. FL1272]|nr:hypothetical protein GGR57DRAFT_504697 [Xylariaceae sp. FL1272]
MDIPLRQREDQKVLRPVPRIQGPVLTRKEMSSEMALAGQLYGVHPGLATLPPLIPIKEQNMAGTSSDMDWDTTTVVHNMNWPQIDNDRRHSGWAEVEKRWARQEKGVHQQQNTGIQSLSSKSQPTKKDVEAAARFPYPHLAIATPSLESDFRMRVTLNAQSASVAVGDGFKKWTTFTEGEWSGSLGHGTVASGGQDSQDQTHGKTSATKIEATYRMKTGDEIPAFIECKTAGYRIRQTETSGDNAETYRVTISMKTTDERYAEKVNFGLWVGSCLGRGSEVVYDAYRIT